MSSPDWNDDDVLMAELHGAVSDERPDEEADRLVVAAAQGVFAWRTTLADLADLDLDLEMLQLTSDSLVDEGLAVRDLAGPEAAPRILTFDDGENGVELEIGERGIVGQLVPPGPGRVELLSAAGSLGSVAADEVGCFSFATPAGAGPLRVRIEAGGRHFVTDWVIARRP